MEKDEQRKMALWFINYEIENITKAKDEYWKERQYEHANGVVTAYQIIGIISEQEGAAYLSMTLAALYPDISPIKTA